MPWPCCPHLRRGRKSGDGQGGGPAVRALCGTHGALDAPLERLSEWREDPAGGAHRFLFLRPCLTTIKNDHGDNYSAQRSTQQGEEPCDGGKFHNCRQGAVLIVVLHRGHAENTGLTTAANGAETLTLAYFLMLKGGHRSAARKWTRHLRPFKRSHYRILMSEVSALSFPAPQFPPPPPSPPLPAPALDSIHSVWCRAARERRHRSAAQKTR